MVERRKKPSSVNRPLFVVNKPLPLMGHIAFGIIDRGTNLLQLRATSLCPFSCIFCSVDAGPRSTTRQLEFMVDVDYLIYWVEKIAAAKGLDNIHAYLDAVGDPLTHPKLVSLVSKLRSKGWVDTIALETHGALLTRRLAEKLDEAGLDRVNLSIDALDPELARRLSGSPWFDVRRVIDVAEYIASSLRMDLLIAPVWVPGINDAEIPRIIEWALQIGAGKKWPPLGIQKYEAHKYGRKPPGVKPMRWDEFWRSLEKWEREYGVRLRLRPEDFGIKRAPRVPYVFRVGERVGVRIVGRGWLRGQWLGVARNRVVTVVGVSGKPPVGMRVPVRIIRVKDNIYMGRILV